MNKKLFTSESVTEGHPDKIADQISDSVLDAILKEDPMGRVACETAVTTGLVFVFGEITTNCYVDIPKIARETIREIGYTRAKYGFDCDTCSVLTAIDEQSLDIAQGVDQAFEVRSGEIESEDIGAGDQGMMFGYATDETEEYMPMTISLAHKITRRLAETRKNGVLPYLRPDGKAQVTIEYEKGRPCRIDTIVLSTQHSENIEIQDIKNEVINEVILPAVPERMLDSSTKYFINPTGRFVIGGPMGDSGLTGRKIIVDTYGGMARHGGGAFSGKDPTKVDRSAAYAVRHVAKNIVAAGLAEKCEIQIAYAIGLARPVSISLDTFGTARMPEEKIICAVNEIFDLRPASIIRDLELRRPIYRQLSSYGHFGREDLDLSWEKIDKVDDLKSYFNL